MKNIRLTMGILLLALTTAGCGASSVADDEVKRIEKSSASVSGKNTESSELSTDGNTDNTSSPAQDTASMQEDRYFFDVAGANQKITITVDMPMAPVLEVLGEPSEYFEAASCAFEGLDKMYTYAHFEIDTYPSKDGDKISAIYLTDDLVSTKEGIFVGSTLEDMEKIYGTGYEVNGTEYSYQKGDMSLRFLIKEGKIYYITYASKVLGTVATE